MVYRGSCGRKISLLYDWALQFLPFQLHPAREVHGTFGRVLVRREEVKASRLWETLKGHSSSQRGCEEQIKRKGGNGGQSGFSEILL